MKTSIIAILSSLLTALMLIGYIYLTFNKYVIACAETKSSKQCVQVETLFICGNRKFKRTVNNEIFSNCVGHRLI